MLGFFRKRQNSVFTIVVFGFLIFTFVLWGGYQMGQSSPTALTMVNGEEVSYREFQRIRGQRLEQLGMLGRKNNQQMVQYVEALVVNALIGRKVMAQKAKDLGITIGKEDILQELQDTAAFQDPNLNRFSPRTYEAVLQANNIRPSDYEEILKEELAAERLRELLSESVQTSETEILDEYRLEQTKLTLDIALFDSNSLQQQNKIKLTEADYQDYFQKHAAEFLSPEKKVLEIASLSFEDYIKENPITEAEVEAFYDREIKNSTSPQWNERRARALHILISDSSASGKSKILKIKNKIKDEESFRKAAVKESEDFSNAPKGGDLGYFNEKAMVKPFSEAIFNKARIGKVHGPVKTDFGYHLIWLLDRTSENNTLQNRRNEAAFAAREAQREAQVNKILEATKKQITGSDLTQKEYFKDLGFKVIRTPPVDQSSKIDDLPFNLMFKALAAEKMKWQEPENVNNEIFAYRVIDIQEPQPLSFAEAKPQMKTKLLNQKTEEVAKTAWALVQESPQKWFQLKKWGATLTTHKNLKPFEIRSVPNLSESEVLLKAVQGLRESKPVNGPYFSDGKWALFRGTEFSKIPSEVPAIERTKIEEKVMANKKNSLLSDFVDQLIKEAKIPEDFREQYRL